MLCHWLSIGDAMTLRWQVRKQDAADFLGCMPTHSVDAIITDPPYGELKSDAIAWDKQTFEWLSEAERALKPGGALWVFGSLKFLVEQHKGMSAWQLVQDIIWEKPFGSGLVPDRYQRTHELAWHYRRAGTKWRETYTAGRQPAAIGERAVAGPTVSGQGLRHGVAKAAYVRGDNRFKTLRSVQKHGWDNRPSLHPTQKPVPLLIPLVRYSCPRNGLVVDPFSGSGSTGVAALLTGRRFAGCDLQDEYIEIARRRLSEAQRTFDVDMHGLEYW